MLKGYAHMLEHMDEGGLPNLEKYGGFTLLLVKNRENLLKRLNNE